MWQISTATLLLNPLILHQKGHIAKMERWKKGWMKAEFGKRDVLHRYTWKQARTSHKQNLTQPHKPHFLRTWQVKKMLPSLILRCWAFFFWHDTRVKTRCLFVCMSPVSQCCFEPYFTLTGIIDTYANRANSQRQNHILWHQKQKDELAGCLMHMQRHELTQGHTQKSFVSLQFNLKILRIFIFWYFAFFPLKDLQCESTLPLSQINKNKRKGHKVEPLWKKKRIQMTSA